MSKQKKLQAINDYLSLYNEKQLDFLYKLISTYANGCIGKGVIMNLAYSEIEKNKIDSALPHDYLMRVQELLPSFDTFAHVYNYNEPNTFGAMSNIFEALHYKMNDLLNSKNFEEDV